MNDTTTHMGGEPTRGFATRRESPVAVLSVAYKLLRRADSAAVPLAVAAIALPGGRYVLGVALAALTLVSFLRWWTRTYGVTSEGLVLNSGVLKKSRMVVPPERIISISTRQSLLLRALNREALDFDTAGTAGPEVSLLAISSTQTAALVDSLGLDPMIVLGQGRQPHRGPDPAIAPGPGALAGSAEQPAAAGPPGRGEFAFGLSTAEIVKVALSRSPTLVLLGALTSAPILGDRLVSWVQAQELPELGAAALVIAGLLALFIVPLGVTLVSVVATLLSLHGFEVRHNRGHLTRSKGLLTRDHVSLQTRRVQLVTVRQNPIQRRLGLHEVTLQLPGIPDFDAENPSPQEDLVVPGVKKSELVELLALVHSDEITAALHSSGLLEAPITIEGTGTDPYMAKNLTLRLAVAPVSIVLLVLLSMLLARWPEALADFLLWHPVPLAAIPLVAVAVVGLGASASWLKWRNTRWWHQGDLVAVRSGLFSRSLTIAATPKLQLVTTRRSFGQARRGLATVSFVSACGERLHVPHIPLATAQGLRDEFLDRLYRTGESWM